MKRIALLQLLALGSLVSCSRNEESAVEPGNGVETVVFTMKENDPSLASKTADEAKTVEREKVVFSIKESIPAAASYNDDNTSTGERETVRFTIPEKQ